MVHVTQLTGRIILPRDPEWNAARTNFNQRFDVQPRAIVYCQNTGDVVNAIRWARECNVPLRMRSGGHSGEGYSLVDGGLVVDVSDIDHVQVHRDRAVAELGAGIRLSACTERLGRFDMTTPLGIGPTVGLAGLVLSGGFGLLSRKFGLTCDNLLEAEIVTAAAEVVRASADTHPDLFWACRGGGGGNFGIATQFSLRVRCVSQVLVFVVQWDWDQFNRVVSAWQTWGPALDDGVSAGLQFTVWRTISLYGMYTPDDPSTADRGADLLVPLLRAVPPASPPTVVPLSFLAAARIFFGEIGLLADQAATALTGSTQEGRLYKRTSTAVLAPLSAEAITTLRKSLETPPPCQVLTQPSTVQFVLGGGAPSRVPIDATAVYYARKALFSIEYSGYWVDASDAGPTISWVDRMRSAMQPYTRGAYVNNVDGSIYDPLRAYYGHHLERLVGVKRQYDPHNLFHFPQSIPLSL